MPLALTQAVMTRTLLTVSSLSALVRNVWPVNSDSLNEQH